MPRPQSFAAIRERWSVLDWRVSGCGSFGTNMLTSADQIVAHLVGDYLLQSDWMANEKTKRSIAALAHALCYALPFLLFRPSLAAFAFIAVTHFVVDRWRLARYVVWRKNFLAPRRFDRAQVDGEHGDWTNWPWKECVATGYPPYRPAWLTTWLLIIADNTMHLICNGIALKYF